ncbi:MAG TPA: DUF983 domain-containing protein [Methylomirabilota bacterium]|nr:DUF983 domain-containing protein [Methylomirabilota bacterium]
MPFERQLGRAARIARRGAALRCPRCGETSLFLGGEPSRARAAAGTSAVRRAVKRIEHWFTMRRECALCGLVFERAQGYFVGAIYINYAVTVTIAVGGYFLLWSMTSISTATQLAIWVPFVLLFPLWFFRLSRSLWLALEYFVNPEP